MWQAILITSNGAWKLGGFGFAIPADQSSSDSASVQAFHYAVSRHFYKLVANMDIIFNSLVDYVYLMCSMHSLYIFYILCFCIPPFL